LAFGVALPKRKLISLREVPRDIFASVEGNAPLAGVVNRILLNEQYGGVGLDLVLVNAPAAVGTATITIDKAKVVTLAPGQTFTLDNVIYGIVEIERAGADAVLVDAYVAGCSFELLEVA